MAFTKGKSWQMLAKQQSEPWIPFGGESESSHYEAQYGSSSREEQRLCFPDPVQFQSPTRQLTTVCNSTCRWYDSSTQTYMQANTSAQKEGRQGGRRGEEGRRRRSGEWGGGSSSSFKHWKGAGEQNTYPENVKSWVPNTAQAHTRQNHHLPQKSQFCQ